MKGFIRSAVNSVSNGVAKFSSCSEVSESQRNLQIEDKNEDETYLSIFIQVLLPFTIAGIGLVFAGYVLDIVHHWPVFVHVGELIIVIPPLLGLKGNIEMTLASRLSTYANVGYFDSKEKGTPIILGNLALVQCQAIVSSFFTSIVAMILSMANGEAFVLLNFILVCAAALTTASLASLILSVAMSIVIIASKRFKINPDNIATPIAASIGDLITLSLLALSSSILYKYLRYGYWIPCGIILLFLFLLILWTWIATLNELSKEVLMCGWTPVLIAMLISSLGGMILDAAIQKFQLIAIFQPIVNGVGGNLAAIQASRMSTFIHKTFEKGELPNKIWRYLNPLYVFYNSGNNSKAARVLIALVAPGHILFMYIVMAVKAGEENLSFLFVFIYVLFALIQVLLLLYLCQVIVHWMWRLGRNPDNDAIPYLTATGDLLGTGLLTLCFIFVFNVFKDYSMDSLVFHDLEGIISDNTTDKVFSYAKLPH